MTQIVTTFAQTNSLLLIIVAIIVGFVMSLFLVRRRYKDVLSLNFLEGMHLQSEDLYFELDR